MLWVIRETEKFPPGVEPPTRVLAAVHRFESGDAAMRMFSWSTDMLGKAETKEGLRYVIDSRYHWYTTAHAMPAALMMAAKDGFRLVLHREVDDQDFIKVWDMAPSREEIMTVVDGQMRAD